MKKSYLLMSILIGIAVSLSIVKAILQNSMSTSGIYLSRAKQELNSYKTQNAILAEKLLIASSLTNIEQKAKQEGFNHENNLMVLGAPKSLAIKP